MSPRAPHPLLAIGLTALAMTAFAANSLLCRLALRDGGGMAPYEFTAVRLVSGAAMLWVLIALRRTPRAPGPGGSWLSAFWLFVYAIGFSFAYVALDAGTGAVLLFGVVQATMILTGIRSGERPGAAEWAGLCLAAGGVVYLVAPSITSPELVPALCMAAAGFAWGRYSLRGRGTPDPGRTTCGNFLRAVPMVLVLAPFCIATDTWSSTGLWLAVASGALASGVGYILWYAALANLTATRAAIVQCSAPVLAAVGGVAFLAETISARLVLAGVAVIAGVVLATASPQRRPEG